MYYINLPEIHSSIGFLCKFLAASFCMFVCLFEQGQAVAQLCRTVKDVKVFGVASKHKHEALQASIDHLLERGSDYASEVRK